MIGCWDRTESLNFPTESLERAAAAVGQWTAGSSLTVALGGCPWKRQDQSSSEQHYDHCITLTVQESGHHLQAQPATVACVDHFMALKESEEFFCVAAAPPPRFCPGPGLTWELPGT